LMGWHARRVVQLMQRSGGGMVMQRGMLICIECRVEGWAGRCRETSASVHARGPRACTGGTERDSAIDGGWRL
jgi:hypothetical protein